MEECCGLGVLVELEGCVVVCLRSDVVSLIVPWENEVLADRCHSLLSSRVLCCGGNTAA